MSERDRKQKIRETVWRLLEEKGVASFPLPVWGRIPNFKGSSTAAELLINTPEFKGAKVIKSNPDSPQAPVRERVLRRRKLLLVPTPRLKGEFFLFSERAWENPREASRISNFSRFGDRIPLREIPDVDLIIVGSVAVSGDGNRVGKGEGYSELEYAILREQGKVSEKVPVVTTVHSLQVLDQIPWEPFDVPLDVIVTEREVMRVKGVRQKPKGLLLEYLTKEKVLDTPYLLSYLRDTGRLEEILTREKA
ncbi:5-formyltetrahydrofolate cyclo-ligase [Metallosphaera tengchongensis]|uniref:5-formyltetrahydrofolate cyclo-ligase n=1 Tax=Metallosphaera tengchongensis TaxID=1532350 RepID=A0A6N0NVP7_9CREN|nr:5-formyltetrahydrofolate cyclo-ligase [Metallosphaera tengchongensis]QKR00297.1 5-formyltetrahydrofolate cyclo-ligase [Metallosphaera tengchongensis]